VEQDPSLRSPATWIPGASSPPVVHGANTSFAVVEEGLTGVVVVVVVVGVVVLTAPPGDWVVVAVGADVPDGDGSLVVMVVVEVVPPDSCDLVAIVVDVLTALLRCVPVAFWIGGFGAPLDDAADAGATVDDGVVDMPEDSVPLAFGMAVVVVPLVKEGLEVVSAGFGTPGSEPGSKANNNRIPMMANPDAIPIPFCRRRNFAFLFISSPHV
jgi:hypothetical protein